MRILVVEDDLMLGRGIQAGLGELGFAADWVHDGLQAQAAISTTAFAAVVLDLGLPRLSGLDLLKRLRAKGDRTPVLILTAQDAMEQRISGLDSGADDYMVKPFDLNELAARLRALIRRAHGQADPLLSIAGIQLDPATHAVRYQGHPVELSRTRV